MYQAMNEKASETTCMKIRKHGLTFSPLNICKSAKRCGCPLQLVAPYTIRGAQNWQLKIKI